MPAERHHRDRPDRWVLPRQPMPDWERIHRHGRIQPMHRPGVLARLFGRG